MKKKTWHPQFHGPTPFSPGQRVFDVCHGLLCRLEPAAGFSNIATAANAPFQILPQVKPQFPATGLPLALYADRSRHGQRDLGRSDTLSVHRWRYRSDEPLPGKIC
jgi:hypothetical protein